MYVCSCCDIIDTGDDTVTQTFSRCGNPSPTSSFSQGAPHHQGDMSQIDHKEFERIIQLHTEDTQNISHQVREEAFSDTSSSENVSITFQACQSDNVGGPLPLAESIIHSDTALPETDLPSAVEVLLTRACNGSVALTVLEDLFRDERRGTRSVRLECFAEQVDLHATHVLDRYGCRWPLTALVDTFEMGCTSWRQVTSVRAVNDKEATCTRLARAIRAVIATTYACVCAGEDVDRHVGAGLAVALGNTSIAASSAIVVISACGRMFEFVPGEASMLLPCGATLRLEAVYESGIGRVSEVIVKVDGDGRLSRVGKIALNVMGLVLMGAGVRVSTDIVGDDDTSLDGELARILWMQAAVESQRLKFHLNTKADATVPGHDLVRCLTIYRLARATNNGEKEEEKTKSKSEKMVEQERFLLAKEEALDIMSNVEGWNASQYLGGEDTEEATGEEVGMEREGPSREEFLHFGAGSSDLPILMRDVRTENGLQICARRGVAMQPDARRSVLIRKGKLLWGRVSFENGRFISKPLVNGRGVLRALVPVQGITVGLIGFRQFAADDEGSGHGSDVANMLLSGAFGGDQALWALKKIVYSGYGVKRGFVPSYLGVMNERFAEDGFGIVSVLGSEAVRCLEVIVDDRGRLLVDFAGDFPTMEIRREGRRLRCVSIDDEYTGGRVGTIDTTICMF